ncbi:uncharacterized protein LOC130814721 [Amaranthus tricolor]|uniref:uncharacterized protein LOC130814721 n=1 Tax=Amaranthus tricolor TaxID=29722 RepID=UPI00258AF6CB|nr:uncharacterized protein LOC130814721 [Amaranthus tricolor]
MIIPNLTLQLACNIALNIEKEAVKKRINNNSGYSKTPKTLPLKLTTSSLIPPRVDSQNSGVKNKANVPLKNVVCFKCHGHGHYRDACPNARAFTIKEWEEIKGDTDPKVMLVSRNGREEESWPPIGSEEPDRSYRVNETGSLQRYENSIEDSESEEERERIT